MIVAQVVQEVLSTRSDVSFTWVCHETYHAALKALFAPSVLERVEFCTWMPQEELISVYDQHGIFLFPSFFEGFGKAPLEAMSRGLVVVASDVGGMRDFIIPNENGRLCAVGESAQFASQVLELLQNRDVCRKLSQAAVRTAAKHTWTRCAVDATKFYTELLEFKARRTAPRRVDARL
jgi:glycosyltransferase involved in cell wall biosynthesis